MQPLNSRQQFQRHVASIGCMEQKLKETHNFPFQTLKKSKMTSVGKALRKTASDIEFFGLRDLNAKPKSPELHKEQPFFALSDSQVNESIDEQSYNKVSCSKCLVNNSKITAVKTQPSQIIKLKQPSLEYIEKIPLSQQPQIQLSPHQVQKRKNLPPLLFSAHIPEPPGYKLGNDLSIIREPKFQKGKIINGRLKEGINWEFLLFLEKQRLIQQASLKPLNPNPKYNMKLKKVNLFVAKSSGNVLGKAIQKLQQGQITEEVDQREHEMQILKEKEKQIDDLIFGRKPQVNSVEELMEMKDFL